MKVAKTFSWEAAHRIPWHEGLCRNLHGHSYQMWVTLEGPVGDKGMVMDFQHLKQLVKPLVEAWDHATLVARSDEELLSVVRAMHWKHFVFPADTTAEHLASYVADYMLKEHAEVFARYNITSITVRIAETATCYAEHTVRVGASTAVESDKQMSASI